MGILLTVASIYLTNWDWCYPETRLFSLGSSVTCEAMRPWIYLILSQIKEGKIILSLIGEHYIVYCKFIRIKVTH